MKSCVNKDMKTFDIFKCFLVNNLYLVASIEIIFILGIIYYIYNYNPFNILTNHPPYIIIFILALGFLFFMYFYFLKNRKKNFGENNPNPMPNDKNYNNPVILFLEKIVTLVGFTVGGIFLIVSVFWLFKNITILGTISLYLLYFLSIIILLAFVYIIFNGVIKPYMDDKKSTSVDPNKPDLSSFFVKLVFYLPCLLLNFIDYIKKQYEITTRPIWILLLLELVIIIFYFLIPFLVKNISLHEGKQLLDGPVYTNIKTDLGVYENLSNKSKKDKFLYNYGISFWLYINPQPPNTNASYTTYTSLFNYGNKPNILYNGKKNSLKIVCQNKRNDLVTIYETSKIKYQKWMHFIVNYDSGTMDIFINNNLVASKSGIAPYMTLDRITAGEIDGVHGGIKNVEYFNRIIPPNDILLLFGSMDDSFHKKFNNPPKFIKKAEDYILDDISKIKDNISEIKDDLEKDNKEDKNK